VTTALAYCRDAGTARLLGASDPHDSGFYRKMGAVCEREIALISAPRTIPLLRIDLVQSTVKR
jgi:hypothetical protein